MKREYSLHEILILPRRTNISSRLFTNIKPYDNLPGKNPIVVSNMTNVINKRTVELTARYGGLAIIPQDYTTDEMKEIVSYVKNCPVKFDSIETVTDLHKRNYKQIFQEREILAVVDENGIHKYTVDRKFNRIETSLNFRLSYKEMYQKIGSHAGAAVVDQDNKVIGGITRSDCVRLSVINNDKMLVGLAVGINNPDKIVGDVDFFIIDTAHGHCDKMINVIKQLRLKYPKIPIIAGNVCTREGTRDLLEAGADVVKVNIGPGMACTTRIMTGVGRPTFTAIQECSDEAKKIGKYIWADGGVKEPSDFCKYIAAGAARVVIGSKFAATYESPGNLIDDHHKVNFGMASSIAVDKRNGDDTFEKGIKMLFNEGRTTDKMFVERFGKVYMDYLTGLMSCYTYTNSKTMDEFWNNASFVIQSKL